jgi:3D-(3,5/4)-trihydroxycyclohexane-1,2-dione acylhydrolase (decyclizing)
MNTQPALIRECNLLAFPRPEAYVPAVCGEEAVFQRAQDAVCQYQKIVIKTGGGARDVADELIELAERLDAVVVSGPQVSGVFPPDNRRHMTVGGSKGSLCGNYAMNEAELAVLIGARAVCQWDCSGIAWKNARAFIHFNTDPQDALHYNRSIPIVGHAQSNLRLFLEHLRRAEVNKSTEQPSPWLSACLEKRAEWDAYRNRRYDQETLTDKASQRPVLTQPAAIKIVCDYAAEIGAVKYFDAGDVQANGFQVVEDEKPGFTFTDTGSSYMGFAVSSLLASAMAASPRYGIALSGEGSLLMNPQVLVDGVEHGVHGTIVIFDNRRMGAISGLQWAQYGEDFATKDSVAVDYVRLCGAIFGVEAVSGGTSRAELEAALKTAHNHPGLSVVHVPVYCGDHELGNLGAWGEWNVGNWCEEVQREHRKLGI